MNDPFAVLDPINSKPKVNPSAYSTTPMNQGMGYGGMMPPAAPMMMQQPNPFGTNAAAPNMMYQAPMASGASFMTQPNGPSTFCVPLSNPFQPQPVSSPQQQQMPNPYGQQQQQQQQQQPMYDNIKNLLQPKQQQKYFDPFGGAADFTRAPEPVNMTSPFATTPSQRPTPTIKTQSSTIVDFDPFSPTATTPKTPFDFPDDAYGNNNINNNNNVSFPTSQGRKRQTQEDQRAQLNFNAGAFNTANAPRVSLKNLSIQENMSQSSANTTTPSNKNRPPAKRSSSGDYFREGSTNDLFAGQGFSNLDDESEESAAGGRVSGRRASQQQETAQLPEEMEADEYEVTFETGRKLGVLMERLDVWGKDEKRQELAVVKLVVENGSADRVGVTVGSTVLGINGRSVAGDSYSAILDMIKSAPRPMVMRFKKGQEKKDTTQGAILTRISNGTFSVGNLTSGNANWVQKYFAFGGAKLDVLQLFVSRAAYHECVISLYEKRSVHTQIQSFRLCRDHKISPIKSKIYKGYGQLHYFALTVPSLRFIAAKFASEDYDILKNLWSTCYDAIEKKKSMGF